VSLNPSDVAPRVSPVRRLLTSSLVLGVAMALSNALSYLFVVILSRGLGPSEFGAFSAVNNAGLLLAIPAGALQVVVARHQKRHDNITGIGLATVAGAGLVLIGAVLSPVGAWAFHLDSPMPVVMVMAGLLPMTITGALQGILLGRSRFGALSLLYLMTGISRLVAADLATRFELSLTGVFSLMFVASVVTLLFGLYLCRHWVFTFPRRNELSLMAELVRSNRTLAGLIALSSVDVLLARHFLPAEQAGQYALASLFARLVFWGTQFVALSIVPALHPHGARKRVLDAGGVVLLLGGAATALAALFPVPLIKLTGGHAYADAQGLLVAFTALGTIWALAQVLLFADMAKDRGRLGILAWAMCAIEALVVVLWMHGNAFRIVGVAAAAALVVVIAGFTEIFRMREEEMPSDAELASEMPLSMGGATGEEERLDASVGAGERTEDGMPSPQPRGNEDGAPTRGE
jgi:O-antigen/teichoic acid export membrane protein